MSRVLAHATHYPHPSHTDDLLGAMGRLSGLAGEVPGLDEIGAFVDGDGGRVIAISVWASPEAMQAGMAQLLGALGEVPFDVWSGSPARWSCCPRPRSPRERRRLPPDARSGAAGRGRTPPPPGGAGPRCPPLAPASREAVA